MRSIVLGIVLISMACAGCVGSKKAAAARPSGPIVTPDRGLVGKVVRVNTQGRFVVLNFPIGHMPSLEQTMNLYRGGLRTGEIRITGPQHDDNIVADVVAGDAAVGDEVRDR